MKIKLSPDSTNGNGSSTGHKFNHAPKVEMPKEPPKEVLSQTFSDAGLPPLDGSEGGQVVKNEDNKVIEKATPQGAESQQPVKKEVKSDDTTKVDDTKKEEKKDDSLKTTSVLKAPSTAENKEEKTVDKGGEKKEIVKQITPPAKGEFDYTGFSVEEKGYLENMSKPARVFAGKLIKDNKELAKLKDSNYLQHPEAYQLSPEFRELQVDYQKISFEAKHWGEQLALCKLGKNIRDIEGYDKNGNPIFSKEMKPTDEMEEQIRTLMQQAYATSNTIKGKVQEYPTKFQKQIGVDQQAIEQECKARFAWESDPKLMDYTVNVEGVGDKSLKQVRQDFMSLFPTYMHNSVALRVASNLMIAMVIQKAELDEARAGRQVADTKVEEAKRTEPNSTVKPGKEPDSINGVRTFSTDGMPE